MKRRPEVAGRPRLYANAAEKTRAYRERQEKRMMAVDRQWAEQSMKDMRRLTCAVMDAQKRGDELALSLRAVTTTTMMADLALYFETGAITPRPDRSRRKKGAGTFNSG
jgi:hypothetical protein